MGEEIICAVLGKGEGGNDEVSLGGFVVEEEIGVVEGDILVGVGEEVGGYHVVCGGRDEGIGYLADPVAVSVLQHLQKELLGSSSLQLQFHNLVQTHTQIQHLGQG